MTRIFADHTGPKGPPAPAYPATRRIISFAVCAGDVDGPALCRMFNQIIAGQSLPRYLSSDNSPLFEYHRWHANLRVVEIEETKTVPYVPLSHPFVERLAGTCHREYLDHVLFWNMHDLQRKLTQFQIYYNELRVHSSIGGRPPSEVGGLVPERKVSASEYHWQSVCRGMYELPMAHSYEFATQTCPNAPEKCNHHVS